MKTNGYKSVLNIINFNYYGIKQNIIIINVLLNNTGLTIEIAEFHVTFRESRKVVRGKIIPLSKPTQYANYLRLNRESVF